MESLEFQVLSDLFFTTDENKRLEGEYIRAMNLKSEVTSLKSILEQERQSRTEEISRLKITVNEVNGMRSMILELQEDLRKVIPLTAK